MRKQQRISLVIILPLFQQCDSCCCCSHISDSAGFWRWMRCCTGIVATHPFSYPLLVDTYWFTETRRWSVVFFNVDKHNMDVPQLAACIYILLSELWSSVNRDFFALFMQYICLGWELLQLLILYSHCCHRVWGICNIIIALFLFKEHISGTDKELARMLRPRPAAQTAAGLENVNGFFPNYNKRLIYKPARASVAKLTEGRFALCHWNSTFCISLRALASQQMGGGLWSVEAILCMAAVAYPGVTSPAVGRAVPWPSHWAGVQLAGNLKHALTHTMHIWECNGGRKKGKLRGRFRLNKVNCG